MENIDHNAHSVYLMYYHLIMMVKYRRKVINELFWRNGIMILTMCM